MSFAIDQAFDLLSGAHASGRLAHAYLVTGPEGSGKRELAARIIRLVNELPDSGDGLDALQSGTTIIMTPQSRSRVIRIGDPDKPRPFTMRVEQPKLYKTAPPGVTKFMVIVDCDRMTPSASNAFLKTLEEPPGASMLLLLTAYPEQLLPTIRSRCICIPLHGHSGPMPLTENARRLLNALRDFRSTGSVSGSLGMMAQFKGVLEAEKAIIEKRYEADQKAEKEQYGKTTEGDWLKQREEFYKALTQSEYLEMRSRLIEYLVAWFGDALRQQNGGAHLDLPDYADATGALAASLSSRDLGRKIEAVEALRAHLGTNVNETLAMEAAFIRAFG